MPRSLRAELASLPRAAWILFAGIFLNKFGSFVIPFLALYMKENHFSVAQAGMAMSAYGIGHFVASGLGGYLADRLGRRPTIVLSMGGAAVSMMVLASAERLSSIVLLTGLVGLMAELYRPASSALLADLVPAGKRVVAFAAYRLAFNAGWAFGPATAGFLAERSFYWLFAGDALTSALFGLVAWLALPSGIGTGEKQRGLIETLRLIRHDRRFLQLLASSGAIALIFFQMSSTYGLQVTALGYSRSAYGALISLNGVVIVLFELLLTRISQRYPARATMAVGYLLVGLGTASIIWGQSIPWLVICMMIFTLGEMISMPVSGAYIADLAPADMRGRYMGVFGFVWAGALILGPAAGMLVFAWNPTILWLSCGLLGCAAAVIISRK